MKLQPRIAREDEERTIARLEALSPSDLRVELGQQLGTLAPGQDPELAAKGWLASKGADIHALVCVEGDYCSFIARNRNSRTVDVVAALSDLLTTVFGGLPVYTLATLLVKAGLDNYCGCGT